MEEAEEEAVGADASDVAALADKDAGDLLSAHCSEVKVAVFGAVALAVITRKNGITVDEEFMRRECVENIISCMCDTVGIGDARLRSVFRCALVVPSRAGGARPRVEMRQEEKREKEPEVNDTLSSAFALIDEAVALVAAHQAKTRE